MQGDDNARAWWWLPACVSVVLYLWAYAWFIRNYRRNRARSAYVRAVFDLNPDLMCGTVHRAFHLRRTVHLVPFAWGRAHGLQAFVDGPCRTQLRFNVEVWPAHLDLDPDSVYDHAGGKRGTRRTSRG
jgi:hypothetical protein